MKISGKIYLNSGSGGSGGTSSGSTMSLEERLLEMESKMASLMETNMRLEQMLSEQSAR